jgi:hypothetical protein
MVVLKAEGLRGKAFGQHVGPASEEGCRVDPTHPDFQHRLHGVDLPEFNVCLVLEEVQ